MWPIDLLRRRERGSPDPRPVLLAAREGSKRIVAHACERARAGGVRPGMALAQARALFPVGGVRIEPHRPDRDRAALRSLAAWAHRFSPVVAADEPDGLLLEVTGCERVFGGERRLVRTALSRLAGLGIRARAAVAPSFGGAWAVARHGAEQAAVVSLEGLRAELTPLPVSALRVRTETVAALAEVGVERIGHLLDLPRAALPARFGEEVLLRLDRAMGRAIETVEPVRPAPPPEVGFDFDGPTDRVEVIALKTRELLAEIAARLRAAESGVRALEVVLRRSDLPALTLEVMLGGPSRDARHLWRLLEPKLERAHLGFGVEGLSVRAVRTGGLRHEQAARWVEGDAGSAGEAARSIAELTDTLANRLGGDRVRRAVVVESHLPERAFAWEPVQAGEPRGDRGAGCPPCDRPTVLFERSMPAEVVALSPDGPVHRLRWRGGEEAVTACVGPERLAGEWWRGGEGERDCFRVRVESGRWVWLVRERGGWWVQGVWA
jgi:protein ImuB